MFGCPNCGEHSFVPGVRLCLCTWGQQLRALEHKRRMEEHRRLLREDERQRREREEHERKAVRP